MSGSKKVANKVTSFEFVRRGRWKVDFICKDESLMLIVRGVVRQLFNDKARYYLKAIEPLSSTA